MPQHRKNGLIALTSEEVLDFALETLLTHVHLYINGKKCTLENVYELLLKASAGQTSVSDVCDDTPGAPGGTAVLHQLHQALPKDLNQLWRLEANLNNVLVANLPRKARRVRCDVAIDLVLVPYHGQPAKDEQEVRRSQARDGTTHFHCYATAYMIYHDQRITLCMTFVRKSDAMPAVLRRLFKRLDALNLNVKKLLFGQRVLQYRRHPVVESTRDPLYHPGHYPQERRGEQVVCRASQLQDELYVAQPQGGIGRGRSGARPQVQQGFAIGVGAASGLPM